MALPTALRLTLSVAVDGVPVAGFPVERRRTGTQLQTTAYTRAADGLGTVTYLTPPIPLPITSVALFPDAPVLVSLNGQDADAFTVAGAVVLDGVDLQRFQVANPTTTPAPVTLVTLV